MAQLWFTSQPPGAETGAHGPPAAQLRPRNTTWSLDAWDSGCRKTVSPWSLGCETTWLFFSMIKLWLKQFHVYQPWLDTCFFIPLIKMVVWRYEGDGLLFLPTLQPSSFLADEDSPLVQVFCRISNVAHVDHMEFTKWFHSYQCYHLVIQHSHGKSLIKEGL